MAQSQPDEGEPNAASAEATTLETVTVTAEKKVASEQTTPIAMSVYDGATLSAQGVSDLRSLSSVAAGLSFAQGGASMPILTVRGISSRDTTEIGDPAVSVSIDGTYTNRPYALNATLYDLERVEVLRGPQGTLYGRNATGGTLNIVTAAPDNYFGGYASVALGDYSTRNVEAALNAPLSETVRVRLALSSRYHDGYRENDTVYEADDEDSRSARVTIAFEPTANFKALLAAQTTALRGIGQQSLHVPFVVDANGIVVHDGVNIPFGGPAFPANPLLAYMDTDENVLRWRATYSLARFDVGYIGGYSKIDYHHSDDRSYATNVAGFAQNEYPETQNHELRVSSTPGGPLEWQAGWFHFVEDSSLFSYNTTLGDKGTVLRLFGFDYATQAKSDAFFGQLSYRIGEDLKLTAGLRETRDRKERAGFLLRNSGTTPPITYTPVASNASGSWSKATGHLAADWNVNPQTMLYAKYDTGYKAGGFTDIAPYDPENVEGFEAGSKSRLLGNTLQMNLAAFDYDYTGQQVSQFVTGSSGQVATQILNAGKTRIYGAEADVTALAGDFGRVTASAAYLHARFTDFVAARNGANVQLAGNRPPQSPTLKLGVDWEKRFNLGAGSLTPRVDVRYASGQNFTFWNYATDFQEAYTMTDASATYAPQDGKWSLQLYVRNASDTRVFTAAEDSAFSRSYRYSFAAPRTFGAKFTAYW